MRSSKFIMQVVVLSALAVLLSTAAFAQNYYRGDRMSAQGIVTAVTLEGDMYSITLNHGGYTFLVPVATVGERPIHVGAFVRLGGFVEGDVVNADTISFRGEPYYGTNSQYRAVPFGSNGWLSGTVLDRDRHLGYLTIRDDQTGATVTIDVRHMDRGRPVNVWGIRSGDHISVLGSWEQRGRFDAQRIMY